jgi:heme-degrading monooxygenase HmoA
MFARVATGEGTPEATEGLIRLMTEREAARKAAPGYEGSYLLTDRMSGKSLVVILWATEADLEAHATAAEQGREVARAGGVAATPWQVYEVSYHS